MTTTSTETPATPAAPAQTPATPAATEPAASSTDGSLLAGVQATTTATPAVPAANGDDWLPEKFRVNGEDGKLDEAASARKLAESYKALEAHKGPLPQAPASPDDYKLESPKDGEGKAILPDEEFKAFTEDPMFKGLAVDAQKLGVTNEQLQFFVGKYLTLAPQLLAADIQLSTEEAKAELGALWKDEKTMQANLAGVVKAINGFGAEAADVPGSRARLMEKYGRDPDFIAFAASVAQEMKEDKLPQQPALSSEADVESLQKSKAYWDKNDPEHARVKAQVDDYYTRKFGTKRR